MEGGLDTATCLNTLFSAYQAFFEEQLSIDRRLSVVTEGLRGGKYPECQLLRSPPNEIERTTRRKGFFSVRFNEKLYFAGIRHYA